MRGGMKLFRRGDGFNEILEYVRELKVRAHVFELWYWIFRCDSCQKWRWRKSQAFIITHKPRTCFYCCDRECFSRLYEKALAIAATRKRI